MTSNPAADGDAGAGPAHPPAPPEAGMPAADDRVQHRGTGGLGTVVYVHPDGRIVVRWDSVPKCRMTYMPHSFRRVTEPGASARWLTAQLERIVAETEPTREETGGVVLIVASDRNTWTFLTDNLAADGFRAIGVVSAPEAVGLLMRRDLDLAIISLPDSDALDLIKQVREADGEAVPFDPQMPLLALTSVGEQDRLLAQGVAAVLGKPFSYPELRARVRALLLGARLEEDGVPPGR